MEKSQSLGGRFLVAGFRRTEISSQDLELQNSQEVPYRRLVDQAKNGAKDQDTQTTVNQSTFLPSYGAPSPLSSSSVLLSFWTMHFKVGQSLWTRDQLPGMASGFPGCYSLCEKFHYRTPRSRALSTLASVDTPWQP